MKDAIIISDIHLGSDVSQGKQLWHFLSLIESGTYATRELILNGDVFDSWDFRRLKKHHWKVLSYIRSLSDQIKITWINGNHDGPAEIVSHLLGVSVVEEYILDSGDKKILALHGHRFDKFITDHPIITASADFVYGLIQKADPSFYWAKWAKRTSKTFLRCSEKIQKETIKYAKKIDCDMVCVGHTHYPTADPEIGYFNSGCWTELPCTYLSVEGGNVQLHEFQELANEDNYSE
jgi:UDP-2,3-diacylglucosamine pyrophosphatase LpxH